MMWGRPAWVPCHCGDFFCRIHGVHAYDCCCPAIEDWGSIDPYTQGGPMAVSDDMQLRLRITRVATSRFDLTGDIPLTVEISARVVGPIDNLLPIMRGLKLGHPLVQVDLVADDLLPDDLEDPG